MTGLYFTEQHKVNTFNKTSRCRHLRKALQSEQHRIYSAITISKHNGVKTVYFHNLSRFDDIILTIFLTTFITDFFQVLTYQGSRKGFQQACFEKSSLYAIQRCKINNKQQNVNIFHPVNNALVKYHCN
jgi:hypothetical protein